MAVRENNYGSSASGTRTRVSAVRGRRPRPLDECAMALASKSIAKVMQYFYSAIAKGIFFARNIPMKLLTRHSVHDTESRSIG